MVDNASFCSAVRRCGGAHVCSGSAMHCVRANVRGMQSAPLFTSDEQIRMEYIGGSCSCDIDACDTVETHYTFVDPGTMTPVVVYNLKCCPSALHCPTTPRATTTPTMITTPTTSQTTTDMPSKNYTNIPLNLNLPTVWDQGTGQEMLKLPLCKNNIQRIRATATARMQQQQWFRLRFFCLALLYYNQ